MTALRLLVVLALATGACGKKGPEKLSYKGTVGFEIQAPAGFKTLPEKDDNGWKVVKVFDPAIGSDILVQWQPGQSFDDTLATFNAQQQRLGQVMVSDKGELPGGRGWYVSYSNGGVEYAKSIVRCGKQGVTCMATMSGDLDLHVKNQMYDSCKSLTCP